MAGPTTVDEYIAELPEPQRPKMEELRRAIREVIPEAVESISYRIPTFKLNGSPVVWFAAFRDHYSLYPATEALRRDIGDELKPYLAGKGTVRFQADQPLPLDLIRRIVEIRAMEGSPYRRP